MKERGFFSTISQYLLCELNLTERRGIHPCIIKIPVHDMGTDVAKRNGTYTGRSLISPK